MSRKLSKELKKLRKSLRGVYGRGHYDEAHRQANTIYAYRLEERRKPLRESKQR